MEGSNNDPAPIAGVKRSAPEEAATTGLDNTPVDFSETDAAVSPAFKEARVGDAPVEQEQPATLSAPSYGSFAPSPVAAAAAVTAAPVAAATVAAKAPVPVTAAAVTAGAQKAAADAAAQAAAAAATTAQPEAPAWATTLSHPHVASILAAPMMAPNSQPPMISRVPKRKVHVVSPPGGVPQLLIPTDEISGNSYAVPFVAIDTTGNGSADALVADADGDGRADCLVLDTSGDGVPDTAIPCVLVDTSGDGRGDVLLVDTTDDGSADTIIRIFAINLPGDTTGASTSSAAAGPVTAAVAAQQPGGALPIAQTAVPIQPGGHAMAMAMPCGDIAYAVQMQSGATPPPNQPGALVPNGAGFSENDEFSLLSGASPMDPAGGPQCAGCAVACAQAVNGASPTAMAMLPWDQQPGIGGGRRRPHPDAGLPKAGWTPEEDATIIRMVQLTGQKWSFIACALPGRTDDAVRNRYLRLQKKQSTTNTIPKPEVAVGEGAPNQPHVAKKGDMWTTEEDKRIMEGVAFHGFKWNTISTALPGRSANAVRNRYLRCAPNQNEQAYMGAQAAAGMMGANASPGQVPSWCGNASGTNTAAPAAAGAAPSWCGNASAATSTSPAAAASPTKAVVAATVMPPGGSKGDLPMAQAVRAEEVPDSNVSVVAATVASTSVSEGDVRQRAAAILEEEGHAPVEATPAQQIAAQQAAAAAAQGGKCEPPLGTSPVGPGVPQPSVSTMNFFWDASSLYGEVLGSIQDDMVLPQGGATAAAQAVPPSE